LKTYSEKDGYDRFVSTSKAAGEPWNKEINFHFECVEGDGFPENQEIFYFRVFFRVVLSPTFSVFDQSMSGFCPLGPFAFI